MLSTEIWGAANVWGGWPEVELLFTVLQKDQVKVWVGHSGLSSLWVHYHLPVPILVEAFLFPTSRESCWRCHSGFVPAALWLASLLFPPWLITKSLSFSGDYLAVRTSLTFSISGWQLSSTAGISFLPLNSGCLLLPLVTKSPLKSILMPSRPAVFFSLDEQVIRKSALGFYVCSVEIQEEINLWV